MPTQTMYVEAIAYALDDLQKYVAASGTTGSVTINALISVAPNASTHRFDGKWLYNATTDLYQSKVRTGSYIPGSGVLAFDPTQAAPLTNHVIYLTGHFPMIDATLGKGQSYQSISTETLASIVAPRQATRPIVPGQRAYDISDLSWLDREERLGWPPLPDGTPQPRLLEPSPVSGAPPIPADWRRPHLRLNGPTPYLELEAPFVAGTSGNLTLNVMAPGDTYIFQPAVGSWREGSGLGSGTDQALPSVNDVRTIGLMICYGILANREAGSPTGDWAAKYEAQRVLAERVKYFDITQIKTPLPQPAAATRAVGQAA